MDRVKVTVVAPVKVATAWLAPGDTAEVTAAEKAELILAGVIAADPAGTGEAADPVQPRLYTEAEWEAAVAAAAKTIAESAIPGIGAAAVESLVAEKDAAIAAARAAEAERDDLRARVRDLELRLTAAAQPVTLAEPEPGTGGKEETPVPAPAQKAAKARAPKG